MAEEFADKAINERQLNGEIKALNLPGFIGVGRRARRANSEGKMVSSDRHIRVNVGELSEGERADLAKVVVDHVPIAIQPSASVVRQRRIQDLMATGVDAMSQQEKDEALQLLLEERR
ncbi:hypothetical protein CMI37_33195 [Candidatus Pacearchaeota archaeon]|nr:hypothetical protein [Candidatus Pacearchaeota archaeon]